MTHSKLFYRLSVWTAIFMNDDQIELLLLDDNGTSHNLTKTNVFALLGFGWGFYLMAFIFNIIYYKIHPSFTNFSPASIKQRLGCYEERI